MTKEDWSHRIGESLCKGKTAYENEEKRICVGRTKENVVICCIDTKKETKETYLMSVTEGIAAGILLVHYSLEIDEDVDMR